MDEFELIRWLDVLVQTGLIRRWQTMLWSGDAPVFLCDRQQGYTGATLR